MVVNDAASDSLLSIGFSIDIRRVRLNGHNLTLVNNDCNRSFSSSTHFA